VLNILCKYDSIFGYISVKKRIIRAKTPEIWF
jgi:hypothetical protein